MKCEQFLFEVSYLLEPGGRQDPEEQDALSHLRECASCRAHWDRLRNGLSAGEAEVPLAASGRLHHSIDRMIAEKSAKVERRASFTAASLQISVAVLVLVASIAGIAYQDHPTTTPPVYARR